MEWTVRKIQDFDPAESRRCLALLPPGRQAKARPQSLLGEWMVRTALAAQFGIPPEEVPLLRTEKGKPYTTLPMEFSITHSGDWVAVAFDTEPIGIDLEVRRPINEKLARRLCTEQDLSHLKGDFNLRLLELWTAKEAHFKRIGTGITNLKSVSYAQLNVQHIVTEDYVISIERP